MKTTSMHAFHSSPEFEDFWLKDQELKMCKEMDSAMGLVRKDMTADVVIWLLNLTTRVRYYRMQCSKMPHHDASTAADLERQLRKVTLNIMNTIARQDAIALKASKDS